LLFLFRGLRLNDSCRVVVAGLPFSCYLQEKTGWLARAALAQERFER